MQDNLNRRTFLGHTASAGAAASLAGAGVAQAASTPAKVVVGVMGMSRGRALAERFSRLPGVQVKYVCDVDSKRAAAGAAAVER
ncbi:MAG: gfo/Idh/MocA family oxidoreductase, partial [Planctomycetaceae bacterium]